ncbi:ornithine carbamoyltransferase [Candidatus Micrarchaeota archaeon]|nr:ornithine carbamoyltransferase [Candidatus Micrarchaeota archaeon]
MHFLSIRETSKKDLETLLDIATQIKFGRSWGDMKGKTLIMLFEKPSTRTRVSFEVAMTQLGGHAIYMDFTGSQISRGETMADTARVFSRYADIIMARLYKHGEMLELSENSTVPVINGLTDVEHPCQALADVLTIKERNKLGGKLAFIGDCANNVANSLMLAAAKLGMEVTLICPPGYPPQKEFLEEAKKSGKVEVVTDPEKGVKGADVIYTDVWVSMGMEEEKAERMKAFVKYQVNQDLVKLAKKDCIVMHCLPAHRGQEITSEVLDGKNSAVWDQAENRLHAQKALLLYLMKQR